MGFWIFMLAMNLLFPLIMIVMGRYFMKKSPKEINYIFGYRTNMSMKNKDTWDFAHKYFGKRWFRLGWLLIPISVIPMLFVIGKGEDIIGTVGMVVMVIDLILLIAPIFPTERALKKIFDKDGNKRNGDIE
ncbi:MAG: SdpI family protein [Clostridia bacterium]|nr:SdpI family protein [Clostridia bacterium]